LTVYYENGLCGYLDKSGSVVIPAKYDSADSFYNGFAVVTVSGRYCIINTSGVVVLEEEYIGFIYAQVYMVYIGNDIYEYYDCDFNRLDGDIIWSDPLYGWQHYEEFDAVILEAAGYYLVIDGKYAGVVDENGNWIVKRLLPRYTED